MSCIVFVVHDDVIREVVLSRKSSKIRKCSNVFNSQVEAQAALDKQRSEEGKFKEWQFCSLQKLKDKFGMYAVTSLI